MGDFRNPFRIAVTLCRYTVSPMDFEEITNATPGIGGSTYYLFWVLVIELIVINVLLAIILSAWDAVNEEMDSQRKSESWFPQINRFLGFSIADKLQDPKEDWLQEAGEWKRVYPAGCPNRRLRHYLVNQLMIDEDDVNQLVELVDVDKSGTIGWEELNTLLKEFKPNIDNRNFAIRRNHTNEITTHATTLGSKILKFKKR